MGSASHEAEPDRERYERIAAAASEVAQALMSLAQGAPTPLDLVVQNITALIDDAMALAPHSPQASRLRVHQATVNLARTPAQTPIYQVASIDARVAKTRSNLAKAINTARQACKALAATGDRPDPSLFQAITVALHQISTDSLKLRQLAHDRTLAISALGDGPRVSTLHPTGLTTPAASAAFTTRPIAMPVPPPPAPPPPLASPALDDPLRRSPRTMGPAGMA